MDGPHLKPLNPEVRMKLSGTAKVLFELYAPSARGAHLAEDQAGIHGWEYKQTAREKWGWIFGGCNHPCTRKIERTVLPS